jgi:hypothetical protein
MFNEGSMNYKDFRLHVTRDKTISASSHEGEQTEQFQLDRDYASFAAELIASGDVRSTLLKKFGILLFNSIFAGKINGLFRASLASARMENCGLRLRLVIENEEISLLPWEYIYDPSNEYYLCISPEIVVSRYINAQYPTTRAKASLPIRILVVVSSPSDLQPLDVGKEVRSLREAFKNIPDLISLSTLTTATLANLRQEIRTNQYHILHFIGHGVYNAENKRGYLALVDEAGQSKLVDEEIVSSLLTGSQTLKLFVLNACQTANSESQQAFVGLAPRLVSQGALAVIAMQHDISDAAALVFAHDFYASIATGSPVDTSIQEARKALLQEMKSSEREFGTPVLFMRANDGYLFEIASSAASPRPSKITVDTLSQKVATISPIYCVDSYVTSEAGLARSQHMRDFAYVFLRLDQIPKTGAWGRSLLGCMRKVADRDLGTGWELMRTEGGIITTATCITSLASLWKNKVLFSFQPFVRSVFNFFTSRQDENGGFGSLSRRHEKLDEYEIIKTQPRHTALAIMALLAIEEGHHEIIKGLRYLLKAGATEYDRDYSPNMAVAFTINALKASRHSEWFYESLTHTQQSEIFGEWKGIKARFIQELAHRDMPYFPFWKPYSGFERFGYESFLLICEAFADDIPELLRHRLQQGLLTLLNRVDKGSGGIPFNYEQTVPDVGLTAFLLSCLTKCYDNEQISHPELRTKLLELSPAMYKFLLGSFDIYNQEASTVTPMSFTYSGTLAKLFMLNQCLLPGSNSSKLNHISKLEQIVTEISIDDVERKIKLGRSFIDQFPECDIKALESFLDAKLLREL